MTVTRLLKNEYILFFSSECPSLDSSSRCQKYILRCFQFPIKKKIFKNGKRGPGVLVSRPQGTRGAIPLGTR